jgi:hypothetical protein
MAFFTLGQLLCELGQVGERLTHIGVAEAAAGNLSICLREPLEVTTCLRVGKSLGGLVQQKTVEMPLQLVREGK